MRAIICDKCGDIRKGGFASATIELNRLSIGSPSEVHLCGICTEKFMKWMEEDNHDSDPENAR